MRGARVAVAVLSITLAACASSGGGGASDAGAADVVGSEAAVIACGSFQDCPAGIPNGPAVTCCVDKACLYGQSAIDALACTDASVQLIQASSYDQSCQSDSDCVAVAEGNFCSPAASDCPSAAINKSAQARYQADVAKTNAGICASASGCVSETGPCCRGGTCQMNLGCLPTPADTLPACADAGGTCGAFIGCGSKGAGPPDACAYADETCCLQ